MIEAKHSAEIIEDLIDDADLPSRGVYTAVGTYPYTEMVSLVSSLSEKTGQPVKSLIKNFGEYLFSRFQALYPQFFSDCTSSFDFLVNVETYIHKEVRKLYPEANLPSFVIEEHSPQHFSMIYVSERPFGDLCEGLILGCLAHFGENAQVTREDLESAPMTRVRFKISKIEA